MKSKKLLALIGCALGGLMLAGTALAAAYHTEDQKMTIGSLRRIDKHGYLYEVDYKADYKLDEILAAEPLTAEALQTVIHRTLLSKSTYKYKPLPCTFACTSVTGINPENYPLLGHNYDMGKDERATVAVHTAAPGKYASVGLADMGWLGMQKDDFLSSLEGQESLLYAPFLVMDGVNEKGFSIATLYIPGYSNPVDNGMQKIFSGLIPRYMLDNARSVQDALEKFEKLDVKMAFADKNASFHWMLNDAYGDSAVVEFVNNQFMAMPKAFTAKHQTVANYWVTPAVKVEGENGFARVKLLEKNFKKTKYPTDQQLADWLEMVTPKYDKENAKMVAARNLATNWTVVYNLEKRTAIVYMKEDFNNRYSLSLRMR